MTFHFILSHPAVPENIGFSCRALKTLGFDRLRLINPCDHLSEKALKTAYGSHDILQSARLFNSLSEATKDIDLIIGTTAKNRVTRHDYYPPNALRGLVASKSEVVSSVALVFGCEQNGLAKEEIQLCHLLSTIPLATTHPSLNLAQSVLLYAQALSTLDREVIATPGQTVQKELIQAVGKLLLELGVDQQPSLYQRIKDRVSAASSEDTKLMLALARYLRKKR